MSKPSSTPDIEIRGSTLDTAYAQAVAGQIPAATQALHAALNGMSLPAGSAEAASLGLFDGVMRMVRGDYAAALQDVVPALVLIEQTVYANRLAWVYTAVGFALGSLGDPGRGLEWTARAISLADAEAQPLSSLRARSDQACLLGMLDDFDGAISGFAQALALAREQGVGFAEAGCLNNLAFTELARARKLRDHGDSEAVRLAVLASLDWSEQALKVAAATGVVQAQAWSLSNRALALLWLGRLEEAAQALEQARPLAEPFAHIRLEVLGHDAALQSAIGHHQAASTAFDTAIAQAEAQGLDTALGRLLEERQRVALAAGDTRDALYWAGRRLAHMETQYQARLRTVARSAEVFADAERARLGHEASLKREHALQREARSLKAQSIRWRDAALRDPLTGVLNRRGLQELGESLRQDGEPFAVAILDADHFKRVNDTYGHAVGDSVLQQLARLIARGCRSDDLLARIGGEEFVLVLVGSGAAAALASCERIRQGIAAYDWTQIHPGLAVTASLGLTQNDQAETLDGLIGVADTALYAAKQAGRNCVKVAGQAVTG